MNYKTFKMVMRSMLFLLGIALLASPFAAEVVILNPEIKQIPAKHELRSIFTMRRKSWPDNTPIRVFVLNDENPIHKHFSKSILSMFPHQLRKKWNRLVFTGTGQAPEEVSSEQEMLQKVQSTPGAIGYLSKEKTNGSVEILLNQ